MKNLIIAIDQSTSATKAMLFNELYLIHISTDARGSVTLNDFAKELPQQFVECGIAEQDAVGISAGLAHSGKKVLSLIHI